MVLYLFKIYCIMMLALNTATAKSPITIAYNDAAVTYLGRWTDVGTGKWSGWGAPDIIFKCRNTSYIKVNATVIDPNGTALCLANQNIDNSPSVGTIKYFSTGAAIYSGTASATYPMINDGQWHNIMFHVAGFNADIFNEVSKTTINSFEVDGGGEIAVWTTGAKIVQCVGDSWMGSQNDWQRLMDNSSYTLYSIATGGLMCSDMDTQYNFNYAGNSATTDTNANAVVVSFGVNDFNSAVTQAAFETSMYSLYDKIRAKQPTAKIFLVRCVKNVATGKDFGQYGTNMNNVVNARSNAFYVDTTSLDATIEWANGDEYHLSDKGKQTLADFVKAALVAQGI